MTDAGWNGKPLDAMSKEELKAVIVELAGIVERGIFDSANTHARLLRIAIEAVRRFNATA